MRLEGKSALITGAARGIGRAFAEAYVREGATVAIGDINVDAAEKTAREIGPQAYAVKLDVTDQASIDAAVKMVEAKAGGLDILVNNAAFQVHSASFDDLTPDHFDATLKTNLYGYFHMAQAAVEHMKPGAAIINTGSVTGIDGSKELIDYSMTKGGIHAFTRALSGNLLARGIRVNCVAPGPVWTPLNPSDKKAEDVSRFGEKTPMKRPAQPEEIAPAYVFLASSHCSSYITGEILPIIGGY
jgi:NAD(P)-dependent dehydrogenase (short-subunit alcohol dehydrogenase family)